MSEAEVSLRLAFWLIERRLTDSPVDVAIDGAQVKTANQVHFDIFAFLNRNGWAQRDLSSRWQCEWVRASESPPIRVHSRPGKGDVVARLCSGRVLRVESKKGPLSRTPASPEYRLMREALGQLVTIDEVSREDLLAIAVPHAPKFQALASRWREAPLIQQFGIQILTIGRNGLVEGLNHSA